MNFLKSFFVFISFSGMIACSKTQDNSIVSNKMVNELSSSNSEQMELQLPQTPVGNQSAIDIVNAVDNERKLIKSGEISFETKSTVDTKRYLNKIITKHKAYVSSEKIEDFKVNPTEVLIVRVPNQFFDALINDISLSGVEFDSKKIDVLDVTEDYIDISSRLKNKKQLEGKYQELMVKASNMKDILAIEKEISLIREDIEATEGRLRYLTNQISYSTLTITYYEEKAKEGFNFFEKLGNAFGNGGKGFLYFIILLANLWPLWLSAAFIWFIVSRIIKRRTPSK